MQKRRAHVDMQRYWWPGYEMHLIGELQKQQNSAQFCDTLLQTEGISVPTHSCVLAALSPYLSQRLSASPSPPSGQKRQLRLQAVKDQTLLKLVGLLYSGELEVKGSVEQNDVLSAVRQFGITDLVERQRDVGVKENETRKQSLRSFREKEEESRVLNERRKMQNTQVHAETSGRRAPRSPVKKTSSVSADTQFVKAGEKTAGRSSARESAASVAQSLDFSVSLEPQNVTPDQQICSTSFVLIPNTLCGAQSDGESTLNQSSHSVTNTTSTSACSSDAMSFLISPNDDANSPTPQEDHTYHQQSAKFKDSRQVFSEEGTGREDGTTNGNLAGSRENTEQPSHANRDEMLGEEEGNSAEKSCAHGNVGMKSLAKVKHMQEVTETTQISIKVKLRRRTREEVWEVVSMQDADDALSVLTSLKQDCSNHKRPQADFKDSDPPPSSDLPSPVRKPETQILQPVTSPLNSPEPPPHLSTSSDSQLFYNDFFTPNQSDDLESVPLSQPPGPAEESDEQIEKMLEDIMMGLNILPNLESDCKKFHDFQPTHHGAPVVCQVPARETDQTRRQMHVTPSSPGCVCFQDVGMPTGGSSTDTAQNHSRLCQHGALLSRGQQCQFGETPTTSAIPTAFYSREQKLDFTACRKLSSEDSEYILHLPNENEVQSSQSSSVTCMDDLRLPLCLSPLEPFQSAVKQPVLNNSMIHSSEIQPEASLHGRPWLTENPASLQFPLSAITCAGSKNRGRQSKRRRKRLGLNPQKGGGFQFCSVKALKDRGPICAGHQDSAEVKSDPRKVKESLKCKDNDTKGNAALPERRKRKITVYPQDAVRSLVAYKNVKVSDGTKCQINLNVCSISLSSNNVLAKEREMALSASNTPKEFVGKLNDLTPITGSQRQEVRGPGDLSSDHPRIRTRGFWRKTKGTPNNTSIEKSSLLKPTAQTPKIVTKQEDSTPRRRRGRPRKVKAEESHPEISPVVTEINNHSVESKLKPDDNSPKDGEKRKTRCRKRKLNKASNNNDIIQDGGKRGTTKRPRLGTLKIEKDLKTKSKQILDKETNDSTGSDRDTRDGLTKETEMDITHSQSKDRTEESHVIIISDTLDENHNHIFNKSSDCSRSRRDGTNSSTGKESSDDSQLLLSFTDLGENVDGFAAETEQLLKDPDEAHLPREDEMSLDHKFYLQTPETRAPPLSAAFGISKSSSCSQEEEDVEVDVVLYSPDSVSHTTECVNGQDNMDITVEGEDEEDVHSIDVTGDETD